MDHDPVVGQEINLVRFDQRHLKLFKAAYNLYIIECTYYRCTI